jgi:sugar diacid utilization regulator
MGDMSMTTHTGEISLAELSADSADLEMANRQSSGSPNGVITTGGSTKMVCDLLQDVVIALSKPLDELLFSLASLTRQVTLVDLCVVMLLEATDGQMITMASSPDLRERGVKIVPLEVDQPLRMKLCEVKAPGQFLLLNIHEQAQLNPLKNVQYETLLVVPLIVRDTCIGLINCYSSKCPEFPIEVQLLISAIAVQASLAIQHHLLLDAPAQVHSIHAFFDALLSGKSDVDESLRGRATALGCDLTRPHVAVKLAALQVLENQEAAVTNSEEYQVNAFRRSLKLAKYRILENYPGSLLDARENILYGIVPFERDDKPDGLRSWLYDLVRQVELEQHIHMFTGISSVCNDIGDLRRGLAEAEEALQVGQCLDQEMRSAYFNELGLYRYLYAFACSNNLRDSYLDQVGTIARYDRGRKRSELLDTLELYLEHGCNIKDTAELLAVHRNTIAQRLERIESLCSSNIQQPGNRLALLAAINIHRLRAQRV